MFQRFSWSSAITLTNWVVGREKAWSSSSPSRREGQVSSNIPALLTNKGSPYAVHAVPVGYGIPSIRYGAVVTYNGVAVVAVEVTTWFDLPNGKRTLHLSIRYFLAYRKIGPVR